MTLPCVSTLFFLDLCHQLMVYGEAQVTLGGVSCGVALDPQMPLAPGGLSCRWSRPSSPSTIPGDGALCAPVLCCLQRMMGTCCGLLCRSGCRHGPVKAILGIRELLSLAARGSIQSSVVGSHLPEGGVGGQGRGLDGLEPSRFLEVIRPPLGTASLD